MKRVGILATGMTEVAALPGALERLFDHDFFPIFKRPDGTPFDSFTSSPPPVVGASDNALKIVQRVAAELDTNRVDLVVILDDLELVNLPHPDRVLEDVRRAVGVHLERLREKDRGVAAPSPWPFGSACRSTWRSR